MDQGRQQERHAHDDDETEAGQGSRREKPHVSLPDAAVGIGHSEDARRTKVTPDPSESRVELDPTNVG